MSKSIAEKALAIAKKKEAERFKAVMEQFLDIMQKKFEERVEEYNLWEAGSTYYGFGDTFKHFKEEDLEVICEKLGFKLKDDGYWGISLSIPEWVKGQKRTQAQLMLYWSNSKIKKKIKSQEKLAREMCKEVLEKLKNGHFKSEEIKYNNRLLIIIKTNPVKENGNNKYFEAEVKKFFAKRRIMFRAIHEDIEWWLEIEKES